MFGLGYLFCWVPRRRKHRAGGAAGEGGKRRSRRRRHIHAKAGPNGLAPVRVTTSDGNSGGSGGHGHGHPISPMSHRSSIAFSDSEYHDALEELGSFSSRTSGDGSQMGSPHGSAGPGRGSSSEADQGGGLFERLTIWWEGKRASTTQHTAASEEATPRTGTGIGSTAALTPRSPVSPYPQSVPREEVIEPSPPDGKVGCISLFHAAHMAVAHKKFVRLAKPAAGASFRGAAGEEVREEVQGGSPVHAPATPSHPAAAEQAHHRPSVVGQLLARLSPLSEPGSPLLRRLLSPRGSRKHARKTAEEGPASTAAAWEPADGETFMVRSLHYMRTKVKAASGPCLYRLLGVDVYSFDFKLFHIAQHVQLPDVPRLGPEAQALPPGQQLPPLLIINLQLPMYAPSLFGTSDGPGHSLVYYFALPEGWEPSQVDNKAALALVQRFVHNQREFDGQPTRDRFKLIPRIVNVAEWAEKGPLSGYEHRLLMNYNDKPLLTRPQQRFYTGPNYLEIDLDVHNYAFIARKAFHGFIHRLAPVVFENAFVVQGNRPEELPEQVLAAARVYRVDFAQARPFPARSLDELGNGTGPAHDGEAPRR